MNFKDNAFDLAIDKGTYDALACGPNKDILKKLVGEMVRVSREAVIIISSGTPEKRMQFFEDFTAPFNEQNKITIEHFEIELSKLAQLINILRADLKDKPLSHALKDKDYLKKALLEMIQIENKKIEEVKDPKRKLLNLMLKAKAKKQQEEIEEVFGSKKESQPAEK
eukprot:CAMPEP_0170553702 /NCGR_PEP_ID=MMETSP0211-20121228/11534_1 /TAXON_ID=311385 /ORGANISM="Pseudokeronopsis sp., Strain OXSARD2" /LENGTH=166 /DNA_ID=CAMNT_0010862207 /DNA_START=334 /DNA_END=834 /DNA_ORIENTATION=-